MVGAVAAFIQFTPKIATNSTLERSTKRILPAGFSVMKVWTDPVQTFAVTLAAAR
jgi:hypothetical protein